MKSALIGPVYYLSGLDLWVLLEHVQETRKIARPCESPSKAWVSLQMSLLCEMRGADKSLGRHQLPKIRVRMVEIVGFPILKSLVWCSIWALLSFFMRTSSLQRLSWKLGLSAFLKGCYFACQIRILFLLLFFPEAREACFPDSHSYLSLETELNQPCCF